MTKVRVRFAPSPTGPLHIGGVRTALYNYLFAKQMGGDFLLRIEDTDQTRFVPGAEEYIIESFKWLGLKFDEGVGIGGEYGPYKQSERKAMYKDYALELVNKGKAYYAFDTAEELAQKRAEAEAEKKNFQYDCHTRQSLKNSLALSEQETQELINSGAPFVIRFKFEENEQIEFDDLIRGHISVNSSLLDDKVLYKSDLMVLEMLSKADWSRPLYITVGLGSDYVPFLRDHLVLEGLAYRVSPASAYQQVDVEKLYENIMHRFRFGGLKTKGIYVDEDVRRMADMHQFVMGVLIDSLMNQGDTRRAVAVCRKWQHEMPPENVPYTESALSMARCFYMTNQPEQGDEIVRNLLRRSDEWLIWIETIAPSRRRGSFQTWYSWAQTMEWSLAVAKQFDRTEIYHQYNKQYESHIKQFQKG